MKALRIKEGMKSCEVGKLYEIIEIKENRVSYISNSGAKNISNKQNFLFEDEKLCLLDIRLAPNIKFISEDKKYYIKFEENTYKYKRIGEDDFWREDNSAANDMLKDYVYLYGEDDIDWNEIEVGTKVEVRCCENDEWTRAYFEKYDSDRGWKFLTSTVSPDDNFIQNKLIHAHKFCRLYKEE